jgi:hypothetical protein
MVLDGSAGATEVGSKLVQQILELRLENCSAENGGRGELRLPRPVRDIERGLRMGSVCGGLRMVQAKSLLYLGAVVVLFGEGETLPIKKKTLPTDRAENIGNTVRWFA